MDFASGVEVGEGGFGEFIANRDGGRDFGGRGELERFWVETVEFEREGEVGREGFGFGR